MAGDDPKYARWIRALPCCRCHAAGPSQLHHLTGAGVALRAGDRDGMPLCLQCHHDLHSHSGSFKRMTRDEKREWQRCEVARLNALFECDELF